MDMNLTKKSWLILLGAVALLVAAFSCREEFVVTGEELAVNRVDWWGLGRASKSIPISEIEYIDLLVGTRHACYLIVRSKGEIWYGSHRYYTRGDFKKLIARVRNPDGSSLSVTRYVWMDGFVILAGVLLAGPFVRSLRRGT